MNRNPQDSPAVRATRINHVSISALDLEKSTRFYEDLFAMERIPTPTFEAPVQWLRVGDMQLHLFLAEGDAPVPAPPRDHHRRLRRRLRGGRRLHVGRVGLASSSSCPHGQVQLYFRDPAGNLIELNWPDADTLDRSRYPELRRLADHVPRRRTSEQAVLYLERTPDGLEPAARGSR